MGDEVTSTFRSFRAPQSQADRVSLILGSAETALATASKAHAAVSAILTRVANGEPLPQESARALVIELGQLGEHIKLQSEAVATIRGKVTS